MLGSRPSHAQSVPSDKNPPRFSWAVLILAVILLAQGSIIVWAGWDAAAQRYYEMEWTSRSTFGSSHGVSVYTGGDAVRIGIGLACFGVMLFAWGTALVAVFFNNHPDGFNSRFKRLLGWVSFGAFVAGCICVYPPWRLASLSFYVVIVVMLEVVPFGPRPGFPQLAKYVLPCVIVAGIAAHVIAPGVAVGIFLGFFATFVLLIYITMLMPRFLGDSIE